MKAVARRENVIQVAFNRAQRSLSKMFPAYFTEAKHNHYADFGFPTTLTFDQLYGMYLRNGLARAAVNKTVTKTWETNPWLLDHERDTGEAPKESRIEKRIREHFADIRMWARLADADRMAMVGGYSGAILRFRDNQRFSSPVDGSMRLEDLVGIIPAWAGQLKVQEWDTNELSETYGEPKMFEFVETPVEKKNNAPQRRVLIHPDRVVIWSHDGTLNCDSLLEPGYNDLLTLEKIVGAGGEGFWKNAKSAPVFEADATADILSMAKAMGLSTPAEVYDKMDEQVEAWQKGFDNLLMLQGMEAKTLQVTLPSPEHFYSVALQSFAASIQMPFKILVGMQSGERSSTEDAREWALTNKSRRENSVVPNVMSLVNRLERFGMLPDMDWYLDWADLTESSMAEKIGRAGKMADVNNRMADTGRLVFSHEEIRAAVDLEPFVGDDKYPIPPKTKPNPGAPTDE